MHVMEKPATHPSPDSLASSAKPNDSDSEEESAHNAYLHSFARFRNPVRACAIELYDFRRVLEPTATGVLNKP